MEAESKETRRLATLAIPYDQTLRVIGQALEPLGIQDFDLSINGHDYTIRGESERQDPPSEAPKKSSLGRIFQGAWSKSQDKPSGLDVCNQILSPFVVLELHFGPEDIERLERQGKAARRSGSEEAANPHTLSQLLRAIGAYVKRKSFRPLKITKRKDRVAIEYETSLGQTDVENFRTADLYDFWVHLYKLRKSPQ